MRRVKKDTVEKRVAKKCPLFGCQMRKKTGYDVFLCGSNDFLSVPMLNVGQWMHKCCRFFELAGHWHIVLVDVCGVNASLKWFHRRMLESFKRRDVAAKQSQCLNPSVFPNPTTEKLPARKPQRVLRSVHRKIMQQVCFPEGVDGEGF